VAPEREAATGYRYPFPPFPEGWFAVAVGADVPAGAMRPLRVLGRELIVYRTGDGVATVLDAHCPHLGAHLGYGGSVHQDTVRCPFHGWVFAADGSCVDAPGSDRPPPQARLHAYPVIEWAGLVLVHHHPDDAVPTWFPELPDLEPAFVWCESRRWTVRVHVQDVAENGFDMAHIEHVHRSPTPELVRAEPEGQTFVVETRPRPDCPTRAYLDGIDRVLWGLGLSMNVFRGAIEGRVVLTRTPIDTEHSEIGLHFWPARLDTATETQDVGRLLADRVSAELEQDIDIWEHKRYLERPMLVAGDGPIGTFRRWARQFHPA